MPTVEGFTPDVLWTTIYGVVAIGLLFLIGYRVYDAIHTIIQRRKDRNEAQKPDFAEQVSQKVIEKLEPRFKEIEKNLGRDKQRLDNHERLISDAAKGQENLHAGLVAICKFLLVLSTYGNLGDNDKIKEGNAELMKYLAQQI